jgi:hypothetical protein
MSRTRDSEWLTENGDKVKDAEDKYLDEQFTEDLDPEDDEEKNLMKNDIVN